MTDYRLNAEPGSYKIEGSPISSTLTRSAESWQFFAFVFAAVVTLALTLIDEMPDELRWLRIAAKTTSFVGLAYVTLINNRARNWLVRLLVRFKQERY